ncbi:MAG TPA: D-2-hydroxyacid dehydrogenase [Candidatus Acidoferrales bacterium]|jgi:phosphoglycerate dehydrogenase-like enzyme|nr:D-2-hydroxyacid dehydrogenase [Candidatus Acidoferrales bacterium]
MPQQKRTTPFETKLVLCVNSGIPLWKPPADAEQRIRARFPEMRVVHLPDATRLESELGDADIFMGYALGPELLARSPKLKWIQAVSAGVKQYLYPELRDSGVIVTNASSVHCLPVAQHTLGVLVALARRFPDCLRYQQQSKWATADLWNAPVRPRELRGQVLLFIGFGAIGRETARLVRPLDMRIWTVTHSGRADAKHAERAFPIAQLHQALPAADFVVIAAPDTPQTRNIIGARELELMKRTAYLINIARGTLIDEPALIAALQANRIAGAALDVTVKEPLPPESSLWKLENCFITPHVSGATENTWNREEELISENLKRWFAGTELLNVVDLSRGY